MKPDEALKRIQKEFEKGMSQEKCKKCGCMKEALINVGNAIKSIHDPCRKRLSEYISVWMEEILPTQYNCNSCSHCYPAFIINTLNEGFPFINLNSINCRFEVKDFGWPVVVGDYYVVEDDPSACVSVSTLSSDELAEKVYGLKPKGLVIIGKTETENIGIDKIIKNIITNPSIKYLIVAGTEPKGHKSGDAMISLFKNGVDSDMKIIGAKGKHPYLKNVSADELSLFLKQVKLIDMSGCEDEKKIAEKVAELYEKRDPDCACAECGGNGKPVRVATTKVVSAEVPDTVLLDKAGYFVITPDRKRKLIVVEHYSYDNRLLRTIEGPDSRSIYNTIIKYRWVTRLSHAAYLGKELARAELCLENGARYVQDGA